MTDEKKGNVIVDTLELHTDCLEKISGVLTTFSEALVKMNERLDLLERAVIKQQAEISLKKN